MKEMDKIYAEMTAITEDVTEYIEDKLCDINEEDVKKSEVIRASVVRTALEAMDSWEPKLTPAERKNVCDYIEARYGICM